MVVKQEYDFIIENEIDGDTDCIYDYQAIKSSETAACASCREKVTEIAGLEWRNEKLRCDLISTNENIYRINIETKEMEIEHRKLNDEQKNEIRLLQNQLEELTAKVNNEYEVEKIIKHKQYKNTCSFLVRWANHDSSHDS